MSKLVVLHFKTNRDQPAGTVSRRCAECGIAIMPPAPIPTWTDNWAEWNSPPEGYVNCRDAKKTKVETNQGDTP